MPRRPSCRASEEARDEDTVSLLVFRAGSQQPKAVPLSLVTRLEEIDCRKIEISDGRHLVQYRDQLMPLLRIDTETGLKKEGAQPILVFSDHGRSMGLVVDEIVDIVEDRLDIEVASDRPGVLGYAVVKGAPPRSSTSAISCRRPSRTGSAAATRGRAPRRAACCWSTIPLSSATCWRR